jgi:methylated-DNA-[protein]-cysteine S-methyltransferase
MSNHSIVQIVIDSPIGNLRIEGSGLGIRIVQKTTLDQTSIELEAGHPVQLAVEQLQAYFTQKRTDFDLLLDWSGHPAFSIEVWKQLVAIPYASTDTYSGIAEKMHQPKAVRAVGMANRNNPIAIIVPCHRVIGKSGHLTGYFYGLDTKLQLLRLENPARYPRQMELGEVGSE